MTLGPPPINSPIVGKDGKATIEWVRWLNTLQQAVNATTAAQGTSNGQ